MAARAGDEAMCVSLISVTSCTPFIFLCSHSTVAGKINLCSPDHISLLVHRTFNVSIPRHHIPTNEWEFEHGPAENDPEFGTGVEAVNAQDGEDSGDARPSEDVERGGRWIHKVTGDRLGGEEGRLEFTVVGYALQSL